MKQFNLQRLFLLMSAASVFGFAETVSASGFQLWEQDGASPGNYHAGRAASAEDASISFYNPAGLVRIHNQQIVGALDPILTNFSFRGTVQDGVTPLTMGPQTANVQGGGFNVVPSLHYATPFNDRWAFGISIVSPFGLKTDYGTATSARYVATLTSLQVVDLAPSLAFAVNDKFSLGAGFDVEHVRGEFDLLGGNPYLNQIYRTNVDTSSTNVGTSYGYGYHLGMMFQFNEQTRVGLSYQSKITQHLKGSSKFLGPLANDGRVFLSSYQVSEQLKANTTFPATTTLSLFRTVNPTWDLMGTVAYTQWNVFNQLVLQNVSAIQNAVSSTSVNVVIPENYHNTFNFSIGTNYHANEQWLFRAGVGYDQSPTTNTYRNLQLPDSNRIAVGLGSHYQANKTLGFDVSWTHLFAQNTSINNRVQAVGDQVTTTVGSVQANADVLGFQVKWDIA